MTKKQLEKKLKPVYDAFEDLMENHGFDAEGNFMCCQSCGIAAMGRLNSGRYVFWHAQDHDALMEGGAKLYLAYGVTAKDGRAVVKALKAQGLAVEWNGKVTQRIVVTV